MTTWTNQSKASMSVSEMDAEFMDGVSITFMDGVNMVFREASTNAWANLSKS